MGRFMSPDPSQLYYADPTNPQSLNLYAYARNNPLINIDPNGLDACVYENDDKNGDATSYTILNDVNGGGIACDGNGFYVTMTQQVTGVGFNSNGDLTVAGTADGNLINSDGSAYNPAQSITVDANGGPGLYTTLPIISSGIQYVATVPSGFAQYPVSGPWTYGNYCGSNGQGAAINQTDAGCLVHDACYWESGFKSTTNLGPHNAALQACNQQLCDTARAREKELLNQNHILPRPNRAAAVRNEEEAQADADINNFFTLAPFNGNGCH